MNYVTLLKGYKMPQCVKHSSELVERICLDNQCKKYSQICCIQCVETLHEHPIKMIPKLEYILLKIGEQIYKKNNDEYLQDEQTFNNNDNELQALARLENISRQVEDSQQNAADNLGYQFAYQGKKWIHLGEEINKMVLNNDKNSIKKWHQSNINQVNQLLLEILDNSGNSEVLRGNMKKLENNLYVAQFPNHPSPHLRIKKFNILFDIQDFEKDLESLKQHYDKVVSKLREKLEENESSLLQQRQLNKTKSQWEEQEEEQQQFYKKNLKSQQSEYITYEQFQDLSTQLWKKSLEKAFNKCLRYVNQGEETCLVMYNFPGYCDHCQMLRDIHRQTIEQLKQKVKKI